MMGIFTMNLKLIVDVANTPFPSGNPSTTWIDGQLRCSITAVDHIWGQVLHFLQHKFLRHNVWNINECPLSDLKGESDDLVVGLKGVPAMQIVGEKPENSTLVTYVSGSGKVVTPMLILKGQTLVLVVFDLQCFCHPVDNDLQRTTDCILFESITLFSRLFLALAGMQRGDDTTGELKCCGVWYNAAKHSGSFFHQICWLLFLSTIGLHTFSGHWQLNYTCEMKESPPQEFLSISLKGVIWKNWYAFLISSVWQKEVDLRLKAEWSHNTAMCEWNAGPDPPPAGWSLGWVTPL